MDGTQLDSNVDVESMGPARKKIIRVHARCRMKTLPQMFEGTHSLFTLKELKSPLPFIVKQYPPCQAQLVHMTQTSRPLFH